MLNIILKELQTQSSKYLAITQENLSWEFSFSYTDCLYSDSTPKQKIYLFFNIFPLFFLSMFSTNELVLFYPSYQFEGKMFPYKEKPLHLSCALNFLRKPFLREPLRYPQQNNFFNFYLFLCLFGLYRISTFVGWCQIHFYINNLFHFKQFSWA